MKLLSVAYSAGVLGIFVGILGSAAAVLRDHRIERRVYGSGAARRVSLAPPRLKWWDEYRALYYKKGTHPFLLGSYVVKPAYDYFRERINLLDAVRSTVLLQAQKLSPWERAVLSQPLRKWYTLGEEIESPHELDLVARNWQQDQVIMNRMEETISDIISRGALWA
ncbi:uncharacterized protein UTRI_10211 [Ustilago trichophora]|uniref:Uncharacterized protein n=1 Tax=Ustilago trichophora TaxID=86804 RepID=A0A5C3EIR3_9BASI|nr:uncharacterized protein UTRI_10211 [Ustilago trichophora]